jgi:hypothetical protein
MKTVTAQQAVNKQSTWSAHRFGGAFAHTCSMVGDIMDISSMIRTEASLQRRTTLLEPHTDCSKPFSSKVALLSHTNWGPIPEN